MLLDFINSNRDIIIARTRERLAAQRSPKPGDVELTSGIPVFLHQLSDALKQAESGEAPDHEQLGKSAGRNGGDLLRMGLSVRQVVHFYGDVCQAITQLLIQRQTPIGGEDFRTLNLCLDNAIAEAVTEYERQRERSTSGKGVERLGELAAELRTMLNTAVIAFDLIKSGRVAPAGSTGLVLSHSLTGLRDLIDLSLADVRLDTGVERVEPISVADLIEDVELGTLPQAEAVGISLTVAPVDRAITIQGDRQILTAAISNLVQNALRFTHKQGAASLTTRATADRVLFEVEDECGGLPAGKAEELFRRKEQPGPDRSGAGRGLSICFKAARATSGEIRVRNLPGKGCVFTLDLPRQPSAAPAAP
jgi:signal transduction histidine kinase